MLAARNMSHGAAIRDLSNQVLKMNSLSIVQRRTRAVKSMCVETCEMAVLETVMAWTGMSARPSEQGPEGGE